MPSYNHVAIMGHLCRDPELRYTPNQTAIVEFGLGLNREWTGQDGQKHKEVCFVDVVCFGKRGEALNKYVKKGDPLFVSGRLKFDTWQAQDGSKRSKLSVMVEDFQFIGDNRKQAEPQAPPQQQQTGTDDAPF